MHWRVSRGRWRRVRRGRADIIEQVLVKVNGEIFTKTDLEQRQVAALAPATRTSPTPTLQTTRRCASCSPRSRRSVIVDAVDELLLVQRGRSSATRSPTSSSTSILENIRKENKLETEEQFQAALKQEGLTMLDLRRQLEKQMLDQPRPAEDVIAQDQRHRRRSRAPTTTRTRTSSLRRRTVTLREILVAVPATTATARGRQRRPPTRQREGEGRGDPRSASLPARTSRQLAAEVSDAPSKANGGLHRPARVVDELDPDSCRRCSTTLKPGEVVRAASHAARLPDPQARRREPARQCRPFEEARDQIADKRLRRRSARRVARSTSSGCATRRSSSGRTTSSRRPTTRVGSVRRRRGGAVPPGGC